jgi:hypothetical protein
MDIKTLLGAGLENAAKGVYPDELKHWWKCDEATGATTLVDCVGEANLPISAITSAAGVITTFPNVTNVALASAISTIGDNDFMLVFRGQVTNIGQFSLGGTDTGSNLLRFTGSILAGSTNVVGADGGTVTDGTDDTLATWALVRDSNDSGNISVHKDGAIVGTSDTDIAGSVNVEQEFTSSGADNVAGFCLYVYPDGLPTNFGDIAHFNGTAWAANYKCVWPK